MFFYLFKGASTGVEYNVYRLMGESEAELEKRIKEQESKVAESGSHIILKHISFFFLIFNFPGMAYSFEKEI